jgi:hypothetical protein
MTGFTIKIEAPELAKALLALADALSSNGVIPVGKQEEVKTEEVKKPSRTKKTEEVKETKEEKLEIKQDPLPEEISGPKVTLEQVRAKLAEVSRNGKKNEAKALISKYGADKLTDIDPDHYAAVLKEAEAL